MSRGDWYCGDCGARYPRSVKRCTRPAVDDVMLSGRHEGAPIYLATVEATGTNPIGDAYYERRWPGGRHPVIRARYGVDG